VANRETKAPKKGLERDSTSCYNLAFAGLKITKGFFLTANNPIKPWIIFGSAMKMGR
jgi:hypothetical protein